MDGQFAHTLDVPFSLGAIDFPVSDFVFWPVHRDTKTKTNEN